VHVQPKPATFRRRVTETYVKLQKERRKSVREQFRKETLHGNRVFRFFWEGVIGGEVMDDWFP